MKTTKPSKIESLKAELEVAKKKLADATARLQPQITAEQARVDQLHAVHEKASKASTKAYEHLQALRRTARASLFPAETQQQLRAAIRAHVGEKFPMANVESLAQDYETAQVAAYSEVAAAAKALDVANDAAEKARNAYWRATSPASNLDVLKRQLRGFFEDVARLETEIERLPRYRQAAKDRRERERQDNIQHKQTQAARALMAGFRFDK